jgi:hypothetical protein
MDQFDWNHNYATYANAHLLKKLFDRGLVIKDSEDNIALMDYIKGLRVKQTDPNEIIPLLINDKTEKRKLNDAIGYVLRYRLNFLLNPILNYCPEWIYDRNTELAIGNGNEEAVEILLLRSGKTSASNIASLVGSCVHYKKYYMIGMLMKKLPSIGREFDNHFCFSIDNSYESYEGLEEMIKGGVKPDDVIYNPVSSRNKYLTGYSALMVAISMKSLDIVELLIDNGANPDKYISGAQTTAFAYAVEQDVVEIVEYIYERGTNMKQMTLLRQLVKKPLILQWMLEHPTNTLEENIIVDGRSLLDIALEEMQRETIRMLKGFGETYRAYSPEIARRREEDIEMRNGEMEV